MKRAAIFCTSALCLAALLFAGACGQSNSGQTSGATNQGSSPLTAPVDYLGAIHKGQVAADKTVDVASLTKAIQMFNVEHGRNPKDLNELVEEKVLPALPTPPYGTQFKYDPASGKVSVVAKPQQ
jgi:hypothetical protein